jgi:hypothetical protein
MKTWWTDDVVMSSIFETLTQDPEGSKQLRTHGLMGSIIEEQDHDDHTYDDDDGDYTDNDVHMVNGEDTAGPDFRAIARRMRTQDQALRRMRREAMAFSEGGRPWASEDIIQRTIQDD